MSASVEDRSPTCMPNYGWTPSPSDPHIGMCGKSPAGGRKPETQTGQRWAAEKSGPYSTMQCVRRRGDGAGRPCGGARWHTGLVQNAVRGESRPGSGLLKVGGLVPCGGAGCRWCATGGRPVAHDRTATELPAPEQLDAGIFQAEISHCLSCAWPPSARPSRRSRPASGRFSDQPPRACPAWPAGSRSAAATFSGGWPGSGPVQQRLRQQPVRCPAAVLHMAGCRRSAARPGSQAAAAARQPHARAGLHQPRADAAGAGLRGPQLREAPRYLIIAVFTRPASGCPAGRPAVRDAGLWQRKITVRGKSGKNRIGYQAAWEPGPVHPRPLPARPGLGGPAVARSRQPRAADHRRHVPESPAAAACPRSRSPDGSARTSTRAARLPASHAELKRELSLEAGTPRL